MQKKKTLPDSLKEQLIIPGKEIRVVRNNLFQQRKSLFRILLSTVFAAAVLLSILATQYPYFPIDLSVTKAIQSIDTIWFAAFMRFTTFLGDALPSTVLILFTSFFLIIHKRLKEALFLLLSSYGAISIAAIIKYLVARPRPDPLLVEQISQYLRLDSFPSGHVLFFIGYFGMLLYFVFTLLPRSPFRTALTLIFTTLLLLIGVSRIYVGAHWLSDVTGAYLIGLLWLSALIFVYNKVREEAHLNIRLILALFILVALLVILGNTVPLEDLKKITTFPIRVLLILLGLSFIMVVLKSWRLFLLLGTLHIKSNLLTIFRVYSASQAVTPLPGGEMMRCVLLEKETNTPIAKITGPVASQAFLEFISATLIAIVGSLLFGILREPTLLVALFLLLLLLFITSATALRLLQSGLQRIWFMKAFSIGLTDTQKAIQHTIFQKHSYLPHSTFLLSLGIALLTNSIGGLIIFLIAMAYDLPITFYESIFIYSSSIVISAFAGVIPGGIGIMEGGMIGVLIALGTPFSSAILVVILFRLVTLVFQVLLGLILMRIFYYDQLLHQK